MCSEIKGIIARQKEIQKIVLPKEVQIEMMKFFLRMSIPRRKRKEQAKSRGDAVEFPNENSTAEHLKLRLSNKGGFASDMENDRSED